MRETTKMVLPAIRPRNPFGKAAFTGNAGSHQKPHKALRAKVRQDLRSGRYDKTPSGSEGVFIGSP